MIKIGADRIPHLHDDLLSHSIRVAGLLYHYGRPMDEVKAGLFHSIYGNEFQMYKINVSREEAKDLYSKYITQELALKIDGTVNQNINPFSDLNLAKEIKKDYNEQHFPLYIAEIESEKYYVIELRGVGLWDAIWGYMSLKSDFNTVNGVSFDHKGETAGLGAEITKDWFKESFIDEKVFNSSGELVGITVLKGNNDPGNKDKDDHEVDAISGSTITGDGVTNMIIERLNNYLPYLEKLNVAQL